MSIQNITVMLWFCKHPIQIFPKNKTKKGGNILPISIYNYEKTKLNLLLDLVKNSSIKNGFNEFYFDSDWENGPNIFIVYKDSYREYQKIPELKECVDNYLDFNKLDPRYIKKEQIKYLKQQQRLAKLEGRSGIKDSSIRNHGEVIIRNPKSGVYNSEYHLTKFSHYRRKLNPLLINILEDFVEMDSHEKAHLFLYKFRFIATLFEDGPANGCLSFLSQAQGFLSSVENWGYKTNFINQFEEKRKSIFKDNEIVVNPYVKNKLLEWELAWKEIAADMNENFSLDNYKDDSMISIEEQLSRLKTTISPLKNKFHGDLKRMEDLEGFITSKKMMVYRDIVNLFYLSLPLFEQSVINKQFYAYSAVKYYEELLPDEIQYSFEVIE
ncbi:hypothetical protein [Lentibacillus sp. CBA3610]|uniref:hypothetical protein n=1 Tax=Lentibacillus sp. CBA3610 TaxID=2518176 RepID=UPI0015952296|nr:hypothetical protein [Lentibacillus sp. CBA3610]QKY71287.1 hypothetical protein Len3610_18570 [Lentibacillus sp. CBA3610]